MPFGPMTAPGEASYKMRNKILGSAGIYTNTDQF